MTDKAYKTYLIIDNYGDPIAVAPDREVAEEFIKSYIASHYLNKVNQGDTKAEGCYWFDPYTTWDCPKVIEIDIASPGTPYVKAWFVRVHLSDSIDYGFDIIKHAKPERHETYLPASLEDIPASKRFGDGSLDDIIFSTVSLEDAFQKAEAYVKDKEESFGQRSIRYVTKT